MARFKGFVESRNNFTSDHETSINPQAALKRKTFSHGEMGQPSLNVCPVSLADCFMTATSKNVRHLTWATFF